MRNSFKFYSVMYKCIAFFACMLLLVFSTKLKADNINNSYGKTMIYFTQATKGNINVQIKAPKIRTVELYIFNTAGELVKKLETETKSINTLQGIKKGQYLYQCFEKDIQLKSGKLIVNQNSLSYE